MTRLRMVAAAALVLVLAGCGTAAGIGSGASSKGTIGPPTQRSPSAPMSSGAPVTPAGNVLTVADAGATVALVTGERLTVVLAPGPGAYA